MSLKPRRNKKRIGEMVFWLTSVCLLFFCIHNVQSAKNPSELKVTASLPTVTADSLDKDTGLILAPGYTLVKTNCVRCHSPKLITDKRATRDGWQATIRWMQQTQGLGDLGKAEPEILDYLAKHYAPTEEGRRPPLKNIKWYKL